MIDFVKLKCNNVPPEKRFERQYSNHFWTKDMIVIREPRVTIVYKDGPVKLTQNYSRVTKIYNQSIEVSLHQFCNFLKSNKSDNSNRFYFKDLLTVVQELKEKYFFQLDYYLLCNEFGFNLYDTSIAPKSILINNIMHHKGKAAYPTPYDGGGLQLTIDHDKYIIKMYCKGIMAKLDRYILRVEIRFKCRGQCRKFRLYSIDDLLNIEHHKKMIAELILRFGETTIVDHQYLPKHASGHDKNNFQMCLCTKKLNLRKKKVTYQTQSRDRKKFEGILNKYSMNTIKNEILSGIKKEAELHLGGEEFQKGDNFNK